MKKASKSHASLFNHKVNITINEELNKLDLKTLAPQKLELANKRLRQMKSLPKQSRNS